MFASLPAELVLPAQLCAGIAALCWLLSVLTREYSWVDRTWSLMPGVYAWTFAARADYGDARTNLVTVLIVLWCARLTFNYARKGGYAPGGEDYRWAVLRSRMPPWAFQVFNVFFIAGYQHLLVFLITLPVWQVWAHPGPLAAVDGALAALFLLLLAGETLADQQQWNFHRWKQAQAAAGQPTGQGFLDSGLWAFSRHPNFFCEQALWWVVYAFSVAAGAGWLNPTLAGPVLLTLLFHGSTNFTEEITAAKYPAYAGYQRRVSRLLPWLPRGE